MMQNVVFLHGPPDPVAEFLRIGSSGHRQLEQLLAAGKLPAQRLVVDAGAFGRQADLIAALRQSGRELVLDTNAAELSSVGRFQGTVREAPWANAEGVLLPSHFQAGANQLDVVARVAQFAVQNDIQRVQAPTHLLTGVSDPWLEVDLQACRRLRRLLDAEGGKQIAIDYPLLIPNAVLNDTAERKALVSRLAGDVPIDSIWLRVSGFGADATAAGLRKYITASQEFHVIRKPIVADGVGGIAALAIAAFGAVSGVAHGVAEKERFDTRDWNKPPKQGGGGRGYYLLLNGIDRLLRSSDADAIIAAPGARRLVSCHDRTCCPHGFEDTLKDPKGHYLRQRARELARLSAIPDPLRSQHFLDNTLAHADRTARQIAKLKVTAPEVEQILVKNTERLDRMRAVLEDLNKTSNGATRAPKYPPPSTAVAAAKSKG
jgi:hypothetical protein